MCTPRDACVEQASRSALLACRDWSGEHDVESIMLPTLILRGEHEIAPIAKGCDELASRIPGARLVVIPGAGHKLTLEQPKAMAEAIASFLSELQEESSE